MCAAYLLCLYLAADTTGSNPEDTNDRHPRLGNTPNTTSAEVPSHPLPRNLGAEVTLDTRETDPQI